MKKIIFISVLLAINVLLHSENVIAAQNDTLKFSISDKDLLVIVDETQLFFVNLKEESDTNTTLTFVTQHDGLVQLVPTTLEFGPDLAKNNSVCVLGLSPGNLDVTTTSSNPNFDVSNIFLRITIANSHALVYISVVVGWIYFLAWSISFYPQIYINYKRKSVVGLNFDFLALNIVGFALYGLFNMGLFWNAYIENEYFNRYPRGLNPVLINDVVFALHAMVATLVTIIQCFFYQREQQTVSNTARGILGVFALLVIIFIILASTNVIHWLDFLYYCSYIKLTITLIKYIPQAVMNFRRKSTVGWSIGNILLDFTGGTLSMLQMILNAYNYDDWSSIFGDPTKFGLGLFSVCFDIFFMIQHYVLYSGNQPYAEISGENNEIQNENASIDENNDDVFT